MGNSYLWLQGDYQTITDNKRQRNEATNCCTWMDSYCVDWRAEHVDLCEHFILSFRGGQHGCTLHYCVHLDFQGLKSHFSPVLVASFLLQKDMRVERFFLKKIIFNDTSVPHLTPLLHNRFTPTDLEPVVKVMLDLLVVSVLFVAVFCLISILRCVWAQIS